MGAQHALKGKIVLSDSTLKGRVTQVLAELDPEERDNEAELNMLSSCGTTFNEEAFFRIERFNVDDPDNLCDEHDDWDIMDTDEKYPTSDDLEYRFSGIEDYSDQLCNSTDDMIEFEPVIHFSNMLHDSMAHNDTLMIRGGTKSKIVTSCVQRTDRFCTRRLIFYSDGYIKLQFPASHIIHLRIVRNGDDIEVEQISRENDY